MEVTFDKRVYFPFSTAFAVHPVQFVIFIYLFIYLLFYHPCSPVSLAFYPLFLLENSND